MKDLAAAKPTWRQFLARLTPLGLAVASVDLFFRVRLADLDWFTTFDDAYMFTRYARHFLEGGGFCWNLGDGPAHGATSPAYLLAVTAALAATGGSDPAVLTGLSCAAGLLAVAALAGLFFLVQPPRQGEPRSWLPLLVIPYLMVLPELSYHSFTGMDTTLALLANAVLACAVVIASRRRAPAAFAFCLAAGYGAFLARPDQGLYAWLLPPLFFVAADRRAGRAALRYFLFFGLILSLDALVKLHLFGSCLPLAFYAKHQGFYQGYTGGWRWNAVASLLEFWTMAAPALAFTVLRTPRARWPQVLAVALPLAATLAYYGSMTQIMGAYARYHFPSLAFVFLMAAAALRRDQQPDSGPPEPLRLSPRLVFVALLLLPAILRPLGFDLSHWWQRQATGARAAPIEARTRYSVPRPHLHPHLEWFEQIRRVAALVARLPPQLVLAASEHGFVGSAAPRVKIVDLIGLHDPTIARGGFSAAYVLARRPDLVWFPHSDYSGIIAGFRDDPVFARDYEYYPELLTYGAALRKDSPLLAAMKREIQKDLDRWNGGVALADLRAEPPPEALATAGGPDLPAWP